MAMSYERADQTLNDSLGTVWVWLHTGDPGASGDANVAENNGIDIPRKEVTFGDPETDNGQRRCVSTSEAEWSGDEIDDSQEITHFSIWSEENDGQAEYISEVVEAKVTGSDGVTIPEGDLEVAIGVYETP